MKPEMITLKHGDTTIKMPASSLAKLALTSVFAQVLPPAANVSPITPYSVPELGAAWLGQGGFNGGLVAAHGDVPAHYLIIADKDVGSLEWGGRGTESGATSKRDGFANTEALCGNDQEHPAANACAEHQADGHHDFYLPACAELYHCWVNVPDLFAKDTYYWSSSQRSANDAFIMDFGGGVQITSVKFNELRVRPVRRFERWSLPVLRFGPSLLRLPALEAQQRQRAGFRNGPRAEPDPTPRRPARLRSASHRLKAPIYCRTRGERIGTCKCLRCKPTEAKPEKAARAAPDNNAKPGRHPELISAYMDARP